MRVNPRKHAVVLEAWAEDWNLSAAAPPDARCALSALIPSTSFLSALSHKLLEIKDEPGQFWGCTP